MQHRPRWAEAKQRDLARGDPDGIEPMSSEGETFFRGMVEAWGFLGSGRPGLQFTAEDAPRYMEDGTGDAESYLFTYMARAVRVGCCFLVGRMMELLSPRRGLCKSRHNDAGELWVDDFVERVACELGKIGGIQSHLA